MVEDRDALGIAVAVDHMVLWMVPVHMQDLVVLADPQAAPMEAPDVDVTLGDEDDTGMAAVVDGHMAALAEVLPKTSKQILLSIYMILLKKVIIPLLNIELYLWSNGLNYLWMSIIIRSFTWSTPWARISTTTWWRWSVRTWRM